MLLVPAASAAPFTLFSTFGPSDSYNHSAGWTIGHGAGGDGWTTAAQFMPSVTAPLAGFEIAVWLVEGENTLLIDLCIDATGEPG
jgi:hypothetical protein